MRVYAESNFVLELVLEQEDHHACAELLALAASGQIELMLPAFAVFEPFTTLHRMNRDLNKLRDDVARQLDQIARTRSLETDARASNITELLTRSVQQAEQRYREVRGRLVDSAHLLPLTSETLRSADRLTRAHDLSLPDAIVLASVLDAPDFATTPSCFVNRNRKDFDDPSIAARLGACRLITRFADGLAFIRSQLDSQLDG